MIGIYKITNLKDGKSYVGQSINITKRWNQHRNEYQKEGGCLVLYAAMRKYKIENFSFEILEECSIEQLNEKEIYWISKLNTLVPNGYNVALGGAQRGNPLYNYEELAKSYLELGSSKKVAEKFNCDFKTVLNACHAMEIPMSCTKERAVYQIDKDTDEIIACYANMHIAYREGLNRPYDSSISRVCRGVRNIAYGYKWQYV